MSTQTWHNTKGKRLLTETTTHTGKPRCQHALIARHRGDREGQCMLPQSPEGKYCYTHHRSVRQRGAKPASHQQPERKRNENR